MDPAMKLEVLMSCMHQTDNALIRRSGLTCDVVVINQCDWEGYAEYPVLGGTVRMFSTQQRGLTRSRNMALEKAHGDICLLCDDDEVFLPGYEERILRAYERVPQADVVVLKMENRPASFPDRVMRLRFPLTMRVSSWQISFRRERLHAAAVRFDEFLGAGTGNGAEEELKFLLDCERSGLRIYYVPVVIASVMQKQSTWFHGYDYRFFENRGATTRYILGAGVASIYAIYYIIQKRRMYEADISSWAALCAVFRGIREDRISKQVALKEKKRFLCEGTRDEGVDTHYSGL